MKYAHYRNEILDAIFFYLLVADHSQKYMRKPLPVAARHIC